MKKVWYVIFLVAMLLSACQPKTKAPNLKAEADTLYTLENQWAIADQNMDKEKSLSFLAPNAVVMPQDALAVTGTVNLRKMVDAEFADTTAIWKTFTIRIDTIEVTTSGDLAYVRGSDQMKLKTPKGLANVTGKWVDIWKKTNGKWLAIVSIFNNDKK